MNATSYASCLLLVNPDACDCTCAGCEADADAQVRRGHDAYDPMLDAPALSPARVILGVPVIVVPGHRPACPCPRCIALREGLVTEQVQAAMFPILDPAYLSQELPAEYRAGYELGAGYGEAAATRTDLDDYTTDMLLADARQDAACFLTDNTDPYSAGFDAGFTAALMAALDA